MDRVFVDVCSALSAQSGVALELREDEIWGGRFPVLRPTELEDGPSFSIALVSSRLRVEAHFVPDTFAGQLTRTMSENLSIDSRAVITFVTGIKSDMNVRFRVNDRDLDFASMPSLPWQRIEIECSKDYERDIDLVRRKFDALVATAGACLTLAWLALGGEVGESSSQIGSVEGLSTEVVAARFERSPLNRLECLRAWGTSCWVCDFDFSKTYGSLGTGFIEVHHVTPLASIGTRHLVDPMKDLVPLCSNCHSMVHKGRVLDPLHPVELRKILGRPEKEWGPSRK